MNDQSFMKSLFAGVVAEGLIFPYPEPPSEERPEVLRLVDAARKFVSTEIDSARIDAEQRITTDVLRGLGKLGVLGLTIPREYGGAGLSTTGYARVIQEIAGLDHAVAVTVGAHQSLGVHALLAFGTEAQKRRYLPSLALGDTLAAFALTESAAGSDVAGIRTRAEPTADGFRITGSKIWITNAAVADLFVVFARTSPPNEEAKPKITAFLVERGPGVVSGPNLDKLGIRGASTAKVSFDRVLVPRENVLGEEGRGFRVAMEVLTSGRLGLAACCVGLSKAFIDLSVERVQTRKTFGRSIGEFGLIKDKIATMMAEAFALESMTYLTTGLADTSGRDFFLESAICKVWGAESLWRTANEAMNIAAGSGYMRGLPFERMLRDARVQLVLEGTNEILRLFVAMNGMQASGKQIVDVAKAVRDPVKAFGLLSDFAMRKARSALGRSHLSCHHPVLAREAQLFEDSSADFAHAVERALRRHGKQIAEMQFAQKRIADMAMNLYALASVISRTSRALERRGEHGARRELDLTKLFVHGAEQRFAELLRSLEKHDDELRKTVASKAYTDGGYPLDVY
ncbi:MAG: acyl-CoA dehydrogenase family protein [Myxococcales bacterium]